jgi:hypothetical protein
MKRTNNQSNYNNEYIDYDCFLRIDCLKVLELFVSNDAVKNIIYNEVFAKRTIPAASVYNNKKIIRSRPTV